MTIHFQTERNTLIFSTFTSKIVEVRCYEMLAVRLLYALTCLKIISPSLSYLKTTCWKNKFVSITSKVKDGPQNIEIIQLDIEYITSLKQ